MVPLPYAPRPAQGEALASWIARLAACNFISTDEFWAWLGFEPEIDLLPSRMLFRRLSDVAGIRALSLSARFAAKVPKENAVQRSMPSGVRGGACPECCFIRQRDGLSHFTYGAAMSSFRVTCPVHKQRLVGLEGYGVELAGSITQFSRRPGVSLGELGRYAPSPGNLELRMERALTRVARGQAPGSGWRTNDRNVFLACIDCLVDIVLWRGPEGTFASTFDDTKRGGSGTFYITPGQEPVGVDVFQRLLAPTKLNTISGLAALMEDPTILPWPRSRTTRFRVDFRGDPIASLVRSLHWSQNDLLLQRMRDWPECISTPFQAAII